MNNFNNGNYYGANQGYGYPYQQAGFGYAQPPKLPNPTNPLTPEEINILKQKNPQFSLAVSQIDNLQSVCTHRDPKTGDKSIRNSDGSYTCTICHNTYNLIDNATPEQVEQAFKLVCDLLETIKVMFIDAPDDVVRTYFQMIPFLKKGPQLYKIAQEHFGRYRGGQLTGADYNGANAFAAFSQLFNPMMGMNPGMMNPGMGMPGAAGYNPGMPMGQYPQQPQAPVPDVTMGAAANNVNPFDSTSVAANNTTVTDNKKYNL